MSKLGADDYIRAGATADDLTRLPRLALCPELAVEALYGLPGRIVEAIDPYTEAAPVATLGHFLVGVGNLIGSSPHALVQHDEHPLRLNIALVGPTAKGRKGSSWSAPRALLSQVDPDWAKTRITTGLSSGEGLIHHVRDPRWEEREVRRPGQPPQREMVLADAGIADKRLLVIEPELATVLKAMARETNTLSPVIRQTWDWGHLVTLTKNSPERATGAHVSIVGHITVDEVQRYLTETERANGFANRFLWLLVQRSKLLPEGEPVPHERLAPLIAELAETVAFARMVGRIERDEQARAIWAGIYPRLSEGEPGLVGAIVSRAEAQVLRLSALYAVLDRSPLIREPHLLAALAVWEYAEASAHRIFEGVLGDRTADVILDALCQRGPMPERAIHDLLSRNKPARVIRAALDRLAARGKVRCRHEITGGRPASVWEAL